MPLILAYLFQLRNFYSMLLLISFRQYRFVLAAAIINLIALPLFVEAYTVEWKHNFSVDKTALKELRGTFQDYLIYDPNISNAWCNTVLMNIDIYDSRLTAIPAGIGTSFILDWGVQPPLKSKYLLMDEKTYVRYSDRLPMNLLAKTAFGDLQLNLEADCYDDLLVYIARNQSPVYLPVAYLNDPKIAFLRRGLASFPDLQVYSGEVLPAADIIIPDGVDTFAPQFALMQPTKGEIVLLPPIAYDSLKNLDVDGVVSDSLIINEQGWEIGRRLVPPSNLFNNLSPVTGEGSLAVFDDKLELVDVEMTREMQPGEWMPVTLYWRLRESTHQDYFAYTQLWDYESNNRSEVPSYSEGLFNNVYPTSKWRVGEVIPDTRLIRLYEDAPEGGYRLMLSVFTQPDMQAVTAVDTRGNTISQWISTARPVTPLVFPAPDDATKVDAQLGDAILLTHYSSEPPVTDLQPGLTFTLTLYWQASAIPEDDYTVFVKVQDGDGNIVAEQDATPLNGQYPTGNWIEGERVVTTYTLTIPQATISPFTILAGMYSWPSLERLPVTQMGTPAPDNLAILP